MASFSIVTVHPDEYEHISAFLDIKILLYYSLLDLGHQVTLATNRFPEGSTAIVFGAHLIDDLLRLELPDDCIVFNTEQLGADGSPWSDRIYSLAAKHFIWDYSHFNLQGLKHRLGVAKGARLRLGYHQQLERISRRSAQLDEFIFYGSITPFRQQILDRICLSDRLKLSAYFGMYGWQRDGLLSRARAVLNLHSQSCRLLEWPRMLPLLANAIPCIALIHPESRSDDAQLSYLLTVPELDPTQALEELYASHDRLQQHALVMQHRFREQEPQSEFTQAALDASFSSRFVPAAGPVPCPAWCDSPARREPDWHWYQHVYRSISDPRTIAEFHLQEGWQRQYHPDAQFASEFQQPIWLENGSTGRQSSGSQRLAVVLHMHQEPQARLFFAYYGRFLTDQADFYITTSSGVVSAALMSLAQEYGIKRASILVIPNRGRDIPCKYIYFKQQIKEYDLCLFSHGKQSSHAWFHDHNEILAGSAQRIAAIQNLFHAQPDLGLVFPDYLPSLRYLVGWGLMRPLVDELLQPQGWDTRDVALLEFPAGGFFWARPAALAPMFELNLSIDQMPEEPLPRDDSILHAIERLPCLAAQRAGFRWLKLARSRQDGRSSASGEGASLAVASAAIPPPTLKLDMSTLSNTPDALAGLRFDAPEPPAADPDFTALAEVLQQSPTTVRLLHFHHYDRSGYLPLTWRMLLKNAQAAGFCLLITSCSGFDDDSLRFIASQQLLAFRRPNIGGCLGALRHIALFAYEQVNQGVAIDRLLFLNDSILPARPTSECMRNLFQLLDLNGQDHACLSGFTESFECGYHLQSFALAANRPLLADVSWLLFWSTFDLTLKGPDLVLQGEIPLSTCLSSAGVKLVALYPLLRKLMLHPSCLEELKPVPELDLLRLNPSIFLSQTLLQSGFGFIKKKRLLQRPLSLPWLHDILTDLDPDTLELLTQDLSRLVRSQAE